MTIQTIRRFFEDKVAAAIAPMPLLVDNQNFTEADSAKEYAAMRLDFGIFSEPVIGDSIESIQGSLIVELYTPKGIGPGRAQELATQVLRALNAINRLPNRDGDLVRGSVSEVIGPSFTAIDGRPHFLARLSCGVRATYTG